MKVEKDLVWGQGGGRDLKLDLYRPDGAVETRSAVVLLHGGGWRAGNRATMSVYGEVLAGLGFLAVAPEYRLLGESPWPAQIEDVLGAVAWVRDHAAELGIDPARVAVQGYSAGGHLALMAGARPGGGVAAVVSFFPTTELVVGGAGPGQGDATNLLGQAASAEAARGASPLQQVRPDFPPTFLLHGTDDWMVPHAASVRMFQALEAAGAPVDLHLFAGQTHEFAKLPRMLATIQAEIALFLRRTVVDAEGFKAENQETNPFAAGPEAFQARMAAMRAAAPAP